MYNILLSSMYMYVYLVYENVANEIVRGVFFSKNKGITYMQKLFEQILHAQFYSTKVNSILYCTFIHPCDSISHKNCRSCQNCVCQSLVALWSFGGNWSHNVIRITIGSLTHCNSMQDLFYSANSGHKLHRDLSPSKWSLH